MSKLGQPVTVGAKKKPAPPKQITNPGVTPVKLKLVMDDQTREVWVDVRVGSVTKPNVWAGAKVDANQPENIIRKGVERVANDAVNHLGRVHGDWISQKNVVQAANDALDEIFALAREANQKAGRGPVR